MPSKPSVDQAVADYHENPSPKTLHTAVKAFQPVIDNFVYATLHTDSPVVRRRAYAMAAGAVKQFDPQQGVPFKKFLQVQLQPIQRMGRNIHEVISVPERHRRYAALLQQSRMDLLDRLDREPSKEELADHSGLTVRQIDRFNRLNRGSFSVSQFESMSPDPENAELPATEEDPLKEWKEYVYHDLDPVDRQIFDARKSGALSNNQLAANLNLTAGAVSQRAAKIERMIAKGGGL